MILQVYKMALLAYIKHGQNYKRGSGSCSANQRKMEIWLIFLMGGLSNDAMIRLQNGKQGLKIEYFHLEKIDDI